MVWAVGGASFRRLGQLPRRERAWRRRGSDRQGPSRGCQAGSSGAGATPESPTAILRVAALVAIASCAVNPWTWRLFLYPLQASANPFTQNFISEWLPPNTRSPYVRYLFGGWILTALGIPAYVGVAARRLDILLVLLGLGMATSSVRHIPVATILATPAVGRALSAAAHAWAAWRVAQQVSRPTSGGCEKDALPVRRVVLDWLIAGVAVVALLAYAVPFAGTSRSSVLYPTQPRGEARERIHYPAAAVQYLREHRLGPRLLNPYNWGGYLIWQLYPRYLVFVDGRAETTYHQDVLRHYLQIDSVAPGWNSLLYSYRVDTVLTYSGSPLAYALGGQREWRRVYHDSVAEIYSRARAGGGQP